MKNTSIAALAALIGADGFELLEAIYAPDAPGWLREIPAVPVDAALMLWMRLAGRT